MKRFYLLMSLLLSVALGVSAQTILDEDFETASTATFSTPVAKGEGWTTVNGYTGNVQTYNWVNQYSANGINGGKHVAYVDCPMSGGTGSVDGEGPREEALLTPELDLNDTYQLSFDWSVSPMNAYEASMYDLQVRVVVNGDYANAETVFSIQNRESLKASGVLVFPISTWEYRTSTIDLSEWKGKKVKLAFVYKMLTTVANRACLDNVIVKKFTPATTPLPSVSLNRYNFGNVYIGEKFYTDVIRLTNTGLDGLKITGMDLPQGVAANFDAAAINLDKYESANLQFSYKAALTTPASANVVLHTNGGDVTIALSATKVAIPDGMSEETFEEYFPAAGWTNTGWGASSTALEGDISAYGSGSLDTCYLVSPRLDLTKGGQLTFYYYDRFESEEGDTYQENDFIVQVSYDGGKTWTQKWIYDYTQGGTNGMVSQTVDLGKGTNNSYVRFVNTAIEYDANEGAGEFADIYLDRVFLPNVYGQNGVPGAPTLVSPANGATGLFGKNVVLKWGPAQFATGYRLYVGTTEAANEVLDGVDVAADRTYTLASLDYDTHYFWKVVPYNTQGNAIDVPVWSFTTQADASVSEFPYSQTFNGVPDLPLGWTSETTSTYGSSRNWSANGYYGAPAPSLFSMWLSPGEKSSVTTQEFTLPANKSMVISFDWGNAHPSDLQVDESGLIKKTNVEPNNGDIDVVFEVLVDGQAVKLGHLSQDPEATSYYYWINESFDLSAYAGKKVQFRWTHYAYGSGDDGCSLDNVLVEELTSDKATFNKTEWKAGKVNYNKAVNSGDKFTLLNKGTRTLKIKSVTFGTGNFESSLKAGDEIAVNDGEQFNLQFNALASNGEVNDVMTVTFESGYSVELPVSGTGLASDVYYYSFEDNALDYQWTEDFTMIDVDNAATFEFGAPWINFPAAGTKFAFAVGYDSQMNGIMNPISGDAALVGASGAYTAPNNWIIFKQMTATANSTFDFYARNWECNQSVLPAPKHKVSVLVSEAGNTKTSDFKAVLKEQEIPYQDYNNWNHYTVDLSSYAGKKIYVALRHSAIEATNVAFFDDFTFSHFQDPTTGINSVTAEIGDNASVTVYGLNGVLLREGTGINTLKTLGKGIYVVKVKDGDSVKTLRIARK